MSFFFIHRFDYFHGFARAIAFDDVRFAWIRSPPRDAKAVDRPRDDRPRDDRHANDDVANERGERKGEKSRHREAWRR